MEPRFVLLIITSLLVIFIVFYISYFIIKKIAIKDVEKAKETLICPQCGSLNMYQAPSPGMPGGTLPIFGAPTKPAKYKCNDCGYEGIFPIIDRNKIDQFRRELRRA